MDIDNRCRSEWINLINEWIHNEIDRQILIRHLLDGKSLSEVSYEVGYEQRQIARRYKKAITQLSKHA